jgi:hypothetical protein
VARARAAGKLRLVVLRLAARVTFAAIVAAALACSSSGTPSTTAPLAGNDASDAAIATDDAAAPVEDAGASLGEASNDANFDEASNDAGDDSAAADDADADNGPTLCAVAPDTCPSDQPSYSRDVVPLLDAKCNGCHTGIDGGPWALTNYTDVREWGIQIAIDISQCVMPPADDGTDALTANERETLLAWVVCGAPEN